MAYKTVDWRGRVPGSPVSNIGTRKKDLGVVIHYSGPATALGMGRASLYDQVVAEIRYQMRPGLYSPGFAVNGYMYHAVVWEDTLYIIRNWDAALWHAAEYNHNMRSYSIHVPIGEGQRASRRTIQTLAEVTDDLLGGIGKGRGGWCLGHKEISATACPGTLMDDFVRPYRAGTLKVVEEKPAFSAAKINFVAVKTPWTEPRVKDAVKMINEAYGAKLATYAFGPKAIKWITEKILPVYPAGQQMAAVTGAKAAEHLSAQSRKAMLEYSRDESDIWDARFTGELWECMVEIESRYPAKLRGLAARWDRKYGGSPKGEEEPAPNPPANPPAKPPTKQIDVGPYRKDAPEIIGRHFPDLDGYDVAEEADRAGLDLALCCALISQESGGRNIFGADWGVRGADRIPFAHLPCTKERVEALVAHVRSGGVSNGVGPVQITWRDYLYEAQRLGGAHIPRISMRVGFKVLADHLKAYGYEGGLGAYNAGPGNRNTVRWTYTQSVINHHNAWKKRLSA